MGPSDKLKFRDNDYINSNDYFLVETNLNKYIITKFEYYNGYWYSLSCLPYKSTSVKLINTKDYLLDLVIDAEDTKGKKGTGKIVKFQEPYYCGINWFQGSKINPTFWVDINDIF